MKHQANTSSYQDNMIHNHIQMKTQIK